MKARSSNVTAGPIASLECSVRPASLALYDGARGLEIERTLVEDRAHASDLVRELELLLDETGVPPAELTAIAVGIGPGSYTGLRVAAAAALGIAYGSGAALVAVPSFEAAALSELQPGEVGDVLVDARGGYVYHATYERCDDGQPQLVRELVAPRALPRQDASRVLEAPLLLADEDALDAVDAPDFLRSRLRAAVRPTARAILTLAAARLALGRTTAPDALRPLYLREFEAKVRAR